MQSVDKLSQRTDDRCSLRIDVEKDFLFIETTAAAIENVNESEKAEKSLAIHSKAHQTDLIWTASLLVCVPATRRSNNQS